jgi:hypothetical protein
VLTARDKDADADFDDAEDADPILVASADFAYAALFWRGPAECVRQF